MTIDNALSSLANVFTFESMLFIIIGVFVGLVIGALPGLSVTLGVALMLPFTFGMSPTSGMLMLVGVYCSGIFGGSITAILLRTPGTAASIMTANDGYALAAQGKAYKALSMSLYASVIGGLLSGFSLLLIAPIIAKFALSLGSPEYFVIILFSLTVIAGISGNSLSKGLIMAFFGMLVSTIGIDPIVGNQRFVFGSYYLISGIDIIPALIGLFAISEILNQIERRAKSISVSKKINEGKFGLRKIKPYLKTIFKSSAIGIFFGAMPGIGGATASAVSYNEARRKSDNPEEFGQGSLDGIAASESANNGTTGVTLIPMMTLGIPGDIVTAVLLGALLIQGLVPGPQLFVKHGDFAYTVMFGFIVVNIIVFIIAKLTIRWFVKVTTIPTSLLYPVVLGLCLIGAYAVSNSLFPVIITVIFGVLGYILPKLEFPIIPILIGLILGPMAEASLRQSLILSDGSMLIFFQRPISVIFIVLILAITVFPIIKRKFSKN